MIVPLYNKVNIQEVRKQNLTSYFDDNFYDSFIEICKMLFGKNNVRVIVKENAVIIKDRINLQFSLSMNEPKVYVYTYINIGKQEDIAAAEEVIRKQNYCFRFFGLETITDYLYIKKMENDFIRDNEG